MLHILCTKYHYVFIIFHPTVKPENTSISTNRDNNTFVQGENITLHCLSLSKPQRCNVTFYNGSDVMQTYTDKTCNGGVAASYVLPNIDGCGLKSYSCKVENEYGTDSFIIDLTYTGNWRKRLFCHRIKGSRYLNKEKRLNWIINKLFFQEAACCHYSRPFFHSVLEWFQWCLII